MKFEKETVLAFDVYGTLIDPHALIPVLAGIVGDKAAHVSDQWRQKQLEYSFRRGLMGDFVPFSVVTGQALDYALAVAGADITEAERASLLTKYRTLEAFSDAKDCLSAIKAVGVSSYAFSNGDPDDIQSLLEAQDLWQSLDGAVSVLPAQSFKPDPATYSHFCRSTGSEAKNCCLVSSNPFDVIGAINAGWQAVWIQRNPAAVFDTWGTAPTRTLASLSELPGLIQL